MIISRREAKNIQTFTVVPFSRTIYDLSRPFGIAILAQPPGEIHLDWREHCSRPIATALIVRGLILLLLPAIAPYIRELIVISHTHGSSRFSQIG